MPFWKCDYFRSCFLLLIAIILFAPSKLPGQDLDVYIKWTGHAQNSPFYAVKVNSGFEYCEVGELLANFPVGGPISAGWDATVCPDSNIYFPSGSGQQGLIQLNPATKQVSVYYDEFPLPGGHGGATYLACNCDSVIYSMGGETPFPINKTLLGADSSTFLGNPTSLSGAFISALTHFRGAYYFSTWIDQPVGYIYKLDTNNILNPQQIIDYQDIFLGTPRLITGLTASPFCNTLIGIAHNFPPYHVNGYEAKTILVNLESGQMTTLCSLEFQPSHIPRAITSEYEQICGPCELLLDLDGDGS